MPVSDEQLMQAAQGGDRAAFEPLVERYAQPIFRFVARVLGNARDAEDVVQEVFLKAWKKRMTFDASKKWKAWIFQIAHHTAIDAIRARKPETFLSAMGSDEDGGRDWEVPDERSSVADELVSVEAGKELERLVERLAPHDRSIFALYYGQDLTFREIGELLKMPLDTVKSRHRRALIRLRAMMSEDPSLH